MNTRRRLSKPAAALFVFALVSLFSQGQPQERRGRSKEFLNLTPEQKVKFEEFRKSEAEERQAHFEKMQKLREDMREAMKDPETNASRINGLIDEMSKLRADQMKRDLARTVERRKILTPEQQEELAKLRDRMFDRPGARSFRRGRDWGRPGLHRRRPFRDSWRMHPPFDRWLWHW